MVEMEAIKKLKQHFEYLKHAWKPHPDYETMDAIGYAIRALEKQIPKKPIMKPYYDDMEEEYLCCPTCGEILTDRIPLDNKDFYFHCLNCGQKLNWGCEE